MYAMQQASRLLSAKMQIRYATTHYANDIGEAIGKLDFFIFFIFFLQNNNLKYIKKNYIMCIFTFELKTLLINNLLMLVFFVMQFLPVLLKTNFPHEGQIK